MWQKPKGKIGNRSEADFDKFNSFDKYQLPGVHTQTKVFRHFPTLVFLP